MMIVTDPKIWIIPLILNYQSFIVQATVAVVVNYDRNTFIVQATVASVINYNRNTFMVQVTVTTVVNYDRSMFILKAPRLSN
jgi:hypothetical protein